MKEGSYGDLWRVNYDFLNEDFKEDSEIENVYWQEVRISGKYP